LLNIQDAFDPKPYTRSSKPYTLYLALKTINPTPTVTRNPKHYFDTKSETLNSQDPYQTPKPQTPTLNPKP